MTGKTQPPAIPALATAAIVSLLAAMTIADTRATEPSRPSATATATFGGGCFWCLEAVFERLAGVQSVQSGYAGGTVPNPDYRAVCTGTTGHAEVIRITFDPARVTYRELLDLFWRAHDPTTPNRQGADVGTQYRSLILCANDDQRREAEASKKAVQAEFDRPVVTEIAPLAAFYPAEPHHQDYYRNNGAAPYCQTVIRPKLKKLGFE